MLEDYLQGVIARASAHSWYVEASVLGITFVSVLLYLIGSTINSNKFEKWIKYQSENLESQFFQVGVTPKQLSIRDDEQHYVSYATGRVNIGEFIIKITLQSRQNFTIWIMEHLLNFFFNQIEVINDEVDITVKLNKDVVVNPFIFAIVNKEGMNEKRTDNYYLSLTKTIEDENKLPIDFVFMTENKDLIELIYSDSLKDLLKDNGDLIELISFSDQRSKHPFTVEETQSSFTGNLKLKLKSGDKDLVRTKEIINKFIELIDFICSKKFEKNFKIDLLKKINKKREEETRKLVKLIEQTKKEQIEEEKLNQLKLQREKLKNNPKELEKLEKKQEKKQQKKMMKKQRVRG